MLRDRLIFGPIMMLLLVAAVWLDAAIEQRHPEWRGIVLLVIGLIVCFPVSRELHAIFRGVDADNGDARESRALSPNLLWVSGAIGLLAFGAAPRLNAADLGGAAIGGGALLVLLAASIRHLTQRDPRGITRVVGTSLLVFVYLGVMLGFILALRWTFSAWLVFGVLALAKVCDIGAYFVGHAIGRHKLIPWLSPGKTWEGLLGGAAVAGITGAIGALILNAEGISWMRGAALGVTIGLVGQCGDLLASALKRDAGIKDSGSLVPGFGGALDVVDSLVFVGPVAYWWLRT